MRRYAKSPGYREAARSWDAHPMRYRIGLGGKQKVATSLASPRIGILVAIGSVTSPSFNLPGRDEYLYSNLRAA